MAKKQNPTRKAKNGGQDQPEETALTSALDPAESGSELQQVIDQIRNSEKLAIVLLLREKGPLTAEEISAELAIPLTRVNLHLFFLTDPRVNLVRKVPGTPPRYEAV